MPKIKRKHCKDRRTPWDTPRKSICRVLPASNEEDAPLAVGACIRLQGVYAFDPAVSTPEDFRRFLWTGLRLLRSETSARGMSEKAVRQIMGVAFEAVHDAGNDVWMALQQMMTNCLSHPLRRAAGTTGDVSCGPLALDPQVDDTLPLFKSEHGAKKPEPVKEYPVAYDLFDPVGDEWDPARATVLRALKEYSESTHADHCEAGR